MMCQCDALLGGLTTTWDIASICVKIQASGLGMQRVCYPGLGGCPSDQTVCTGPVNQATCFDTLPAAKCTRKLAKGKCRKKRILTKKCRATCGDCH